ncbi:unnamed protein product [Closterium sp. Naga37s-1]|nr:unnamed protein product [Closterium sp. Naga37s-1]
MRRTSVLNRRDLLAGSLAAPLALTLAGSASAEQEASDFVTFDNPKEKYTFQVPAGWVRSEGTAGVRQVIAFHPPDRTDANVTILITLLSADFTSLGSFGTVDAFAETLVNGLDRSWQPSPGQKAVLLGAKSDNDAYLVEYTLQKPSEPAIHLYSAVATGQNVWYNNLFTFTGQYPEEEAATFKPTVDKASLSVSQFSGLKALPQKAVSLKTKTSFAVSKARTTCAIDPAPVICGATALLLAAGRFGFNDYHKNSLKRAGLPVQNGVSHAAAGDSGAAEAELFTKTNDPAGFTLADTLAWGALGHAFGFALLAVANNGYQWGF